MLYYFILLTLPLFLFRTQKKKKKIALIAPHLLKFLGLFVADLWSLQIAAFRLSSPAP
jgi:hypothetical protein